MSIQRTVTAASEAWSLLKGLVCVHKPAGVPPDRCVKQVRRILLSDLNDLSTEEKTENQDQMSKIQQEGGLIDYSSHPLVLGSLFEDEDLITNKVNSPSEHQSGLLLFTVNDGDHCDVIKDFRLLRQYRIEAEFGKATDTSFHWGKVIEKSTYDHVKGRPQVLEHFLATIRSCHQRDAFKQAGVRLTSQEAYEMAVKGLVRPHENFESGSLIYGLDLVKFKPPNWAVNVTCVNETAEFLAELIAEIGLKMKTNAVVNSLQLIRYGPIHTEHSLLLKHVSLQSVFDNMTLMRRLTKDLELRSSMYK